MTKVLIICCVLFAPAAFAQVWQKVDTVARLSPMGTFARPATTMLKPGQPIPQDYYTTTFGFFCRQELKMQQAHVPVTFRLGSMDYCNWLEQKPGYKTQNH